MESRKANPTIKFNYKGFYSKSVNNRKIFTDFVALGRDK